MEIQRTLAALGLEQAAVWIVSSVAGMMAAWFTSPDTRLGFLIVLLGVMFAAILLYGLAGFMRRQWAPPDGVVTSPLELPPAVPPKESQPPFLVRFKEKWPNGYVGSVSEGPVYDELVLEIRNASGRAFTGVEVYLIGTSSALNTRKPLRRKIEKTYLFNRRSVSEFNPGQSEDYVLVSMNRESGMAYWGDHRLAENIHALNTAFPNQHVVEVTVTSREAQPFTEKMVIILTENKPAILPVFPRPTAPIWNG